MSQFQLAYYFRQQCKFRLKDGKEVYGVVWEDGYGHDKRYFFASASDHKAYEMAVEQGDYESMERLKQPLDPSMIISAERIAC